MTREVIPRDTGIFDEHAVVMTLGHSISAIEVMTWWACLRGDPASRPSP